MLYVDNYVETAEGKLSLICPAVYLECWQLHFKGLRWIVSASLACAFLGGVLQACADSTYLGPGTETLRHCRSFIC